MGLFGKVIKARELKSFDKQQLRRVIDIREITDFKKGHIPGVRNVSMTKLVGNPKAFLKDNQEYYIICRVECEVGSQFLT